MPNTVGRLSRLRVNVFQVDAATLAARAQGLFAAEGLEPEITVTSSSTQQMRGLSNGSYNLIGTAFDNVLAWSGKEGAEIIAVSQAGDRLVLPVFVRPEIKGWSDLRGKKLAADAVDTAFALVLRRILLAQGLDFARGDYELVAVGATGPRLESMKRGETVAAILNAPVDARAIEAGLIRLGDSSEVLPNYPDAVWAVNRGWAESHRRELVGFLKAWLAGVRWVRDPTHRDAAVKLVVEELHLSPQVAAGVLGRVSSNGMLGLAGPQTVVDLRNHFGFALIRGASLEPYYDLRYYREAGRRQ